MNSARDLAAPFDLWASRTSTISVLPFAIIACACAGVILGTAVFAISIICLTLVAI